MGQESIHRRALRGGVVSAANFAVNMLLNVLQVWVLLRWWPRETYGLWLAVVAASTLLTTFDTGHLAYVGNKMTAEWMADREALRRTLGSAIRMALLTGGVQLAIAAWLCLSGAIYPVLSLDPRTSGGFAVALLIYTAGWIAMGSLASIIVRLMPAGGYFVRATVWGIAIRLIQFASLVVAARSGWSLPWVTLFYYAVGAVVAIFFYRDIWKLFPDLTPWWSKGDLRTGLANLARSTVLTVAGILDGLTLQGVVLFVTSALGAAVVPLFTTLRTIANMAMQGTSFLLAPVMPDIVRFDVRGEPQKLAAVFQFFWFCSGLLFNVGMVALLFFVEPAYRIWTQGKLPFDRVLFAWLAAGVVLRSLGAPFTTLSSSLNWLRAQMILSAVRTGVTVLGVLALFPSHGLAGIGAALAIAEAIGSVMAPGLFVRSEFVRLRGHFPARDFAIAAASALVAVGALAAFAVARETAPWTSAGAIAVMAAIGAAQWRLLSPELRARVGSLARRA
jgi:O-antigen/teichoic acid export membrane protein